MLVFMNSGAGICVQLCVIFSIDRLIVCRGTVAWQSACCIDSGLQLKATVAQLALATPVGGISTAARHPDIPAVRVVPIWPGADRQTVNR
jgi:hypothetical protein